MNQSMVTAIEMEHPNIKGIQSDAAGLAYFFSDDDQRVAIAGQHGVTILTKAQAQAVASEILEVMDLFVPKQTRRERA